MYQYRNGFIQAVREGNRNRIFLMLEQRHAADFANGPAGVKYYATLTPSLTPPAQGRRKHYYWSNGADGARLHAAKRATMIAVEPLWRITLTADKSASDFNSPSKQFSHSVRKSDLAANGVGCRLGRPLRLD